MISAARTADEYLAELPPERRAPMTALRKLILRHLPPGYEESMQHGMIGYGIPLSRYPDTYNGQPLGVAALAAQKQYMALYLMAVYADPAKERQLVEAFRNEGKKLDKGKSCIRFQSLEALPLQALGKLIASTSVEDFIALYEANRGTSTKRPSPRKAPARKPAARKTPARKTAARKAPPRKAAASTAAPQRKAKKRSPRKKTRSAS